MDYGTSFHTFFKLGVLGESRSPKNRNFPIADQPDGLGSERRGPVGDHSRRRPEVMAWRQMPGCTRHFSRLFVHHPVAPVRNALDGQARHKLSESVQVLDQQRCVCLAPNYQSLTVSLAGSMAKLPRAAVPSGDGGPTRLAR